MRCDRCREDIKEGEERELHGQTLCEDCYMDTLSPAKACDPWAVHSAKSFAKEDGSNVEITETQSKILQITTVRLRFFEHNLTICKYTKY